MNFHFNSNKTDHRHEKLTHQTSKLDVEGTDDFDVRGDEREGFDALTAQDNYQESESQRLKDKNKKNEMRKMELVDDDHKGDDDPDSNFSMQTFDAGLEDQLIVLVEHHGSDDEFVIGYGDEDDNSKYQNRDSKEALDETETVQKNETDKDLFTTSKLSPHIESVTNVLQTETTPAINSASANISISSLGSDSEHEEAGHPRDAPDTRVSKVTQGYTFQICCSLQGLKRNVS